MENVAGEQGLSTPPKALGSLFFSNFYFFKILFNFNVNTEEKGDKVFINF